jgi:hypothetical protein
MWRVLLEPTHAQKEREYHKNAWSNKQTAKLREMLGREKFNRAVAFFNRCGYANESVEQYLERWRAFLTVGDGRDWLSKEQLATIEWFYPGHPADIADAKRCAAINAEFRAGWDAIMAAVREHNPDDFAWQEREALRLFNNTRNDGEPLLRLRSWARQLASQGMVPVEWAGGRALAQAIAGAKQAARNLANKMRGVPSNK